jgi:serine/threonine protein kinase
MSGEPKREILIFTEALRLPVEARSDYVDRACDRDEDLRCKVRALLDANDRAGRFMEELPSAFAEERIQQARAIEKQGDWIGRYRLLQQIGEGGWGVVFLAEQKEPVRRKVALKVIKPGMDTKSVIARFEAERQALALMDHPNIARVIDAGMTDGGRPFFVMELVEGVKITDYCDQHSLSTKARLGLFTQVCDAIQHAHQKGIIHRDIKPSNILVTTGTDGRPVPKVIDFGVAKATGGQQLTDKTIFTARDMLIGTPAYMSPEQVSLMSADVDTRTDIYSLGVLLYELLTGTTPFDTRELLKAGFDEVRRVIRDEEPPRPSTRLSTLMEADTENFSKHFGVAPPWLIRELQGELDWIVMRALEKDRARRYATAHGLGVDVGRYLSGEPVSARPPSGLYKARKFVARNKLPCASLATILVLLATGLAVVTRLLVVEKQERVRAQHQGEVYRLEGLGTMYWQQGNLGEAEKCFRQSFAIRRQFLGGSPPNLVVATQFLVLLEQENKYDDSDQLFDGFPKSHLLALPGYASLFAEIGESIAMKGRWRQATNDVTNLVKTEPDSPNGYHTLAPLLVACGDVPEYRRLCQQIVLHFRGAQDPNTADRMAKDCLILPSSGADLNIVGALADVAVSKYPSYSLFQCCKALAEYRQERFSEAVKWADSATKDPFSYSKAEGYAILSMARFKSGQTNEAFIALAECDKVIEEQLPKLSNGNLGQDWRDWIIAHALQKEAKALVNRATP